MNLLKILDLIKIAIPGLQLIIEKWQNRKRYNAEDINKNVEAELEKIRQWKESSKSDREIAYGDK